MDEQVKPATIFAHSELCDVFAPFNGDDKPCNCHVARIAELESQLLKSLNVSGRVAIWFCGKCGQEYCQWSVLSTLNCPECKRKALEAELLSAQQELAATKAGQVVGQYSALGAMQYKQIKELEAELVSAQQELKTTKREADRWNEHDKSCRIARDKGWTFELLLQYVSDTSDGFECLPKCDSYSHEELCPVTNVVQAFKLLRGELAGAQKRIKLIRDRSELGAHQSIWKSCVCNNCYIYRIAVNEKWAFDKGEG